MKNYQLLSRLFLLALAWLGGNLLFAQASAGQSPQTAEKIAQLVKEDPHGYVLTITAVLVVFTALLLLIIVFTSVGKLMQIIEGKAKEKASPSPEKQVKVKRAISKVPLNEEESLAVSMALTQELEQRKGEIMTAIALALHSERETLHDEESYCLTIKHTTPSNWLNRSQFMRQLP